MEFSKFTAKTLEEALALAAAEKQVDQEVLEYKIIEEKSGFLGIGKAVQIEVFSPLDIRDFIRDYILTYFRNAQIDGVCEVEYEAPDFYRISVDTDINALLIGRSGKTLQLFTRLVRMAASAAFKRRVRCLIDVNGYKQERYDKVIRTAIRVARDVRRTKMDATLLPMPADERKAVHQALQAMDSITTKSMGEGAERRLHILYTPSKEKPE